jgi:hypothetical protein
VPFAKIDFIDRDLFEFFEFRPAHLVNAPLPKPDAYNRDVRLALRRSLIEKSLDFWRELTLGLYGRDNDFEVVFAQGNGFELSAPRVMSGRHGGIWPKLVDSVS